jgi:hypothetical protein
MDLKEIGFEGVDWINFPQNRDKWRNVVTTVMTLRAPKNARDLLTSRETVTYSIRTPLYRVSSVSFAEYGADSGSAFIRRVI